MILNSQHMLSISKFWSVLSRLLYAVEMLTAEVQDSIKLLPLEKTRCWLLKVWKDRVSQNSIREKA